MLNQALRLPMQDHGWQKRSGELSADCNYPWWTIRSVNWSTPTCWEILSGHKGWTVSLVDIFAFFHMYFSLFMHVSCHMCMWIYSPAVSWPHILCLHCNCIQDPTDPSCGPRLIHALTKNGAAPHKVGYQCTTYIYHSKGKKYVRCIWGTKTLIWCAISTTGCMWNHQKLSKPLAALCILFVVLYKS